MFSKYGNSYGSFLFDRREFCTKDPEMMRQIFIKEFSHFQNRFNLLPERKEAPKSLMRNMLSVLCDEDWKRVRNRITPAFTTGKLKKLIPILCDSSERLCKVIEKDYAQEQKELPLKDIYGRFLLDVIGRSGFSLDLNTFEEENIFVEQARSVFNFGQRGQRIRLILAMFFPLMSVFYEHLTGKNFTFSVDEQFFIDMMSDLYKKRRADPEAKEKYSDIFQLLMNVVDEEDESMHGNAISADDAEIFHKELRTNDQQKQQGKHLTRIELFAQSFIILIAGFETTGATLTFATYMLAIETEVQEKLRSEVNDVLGEKELMTYEDLRQMHYLRAVVQETLRMFPVAPKINRECNSDCVINGVPFQKGDLVSVPVYFIQHDEAFFPEPDQFDPERFMPAQKTTHDPLAFLTFGLGPRNCIGMRFAEFQMHVALALVVRRFRFTPGPNTTVGKNRGQKNATKYTQNVCSKYYKTVPNSVCIRVAPGYPKPETRPEVVFSADLIRNPTRHFFRPGTSLKYPPKLLSSDMLRTEEPLVVIAEKI
ncbi:Cytochrome P450 3A4 [Globodera pallida]|nr:Cytochrome P450 3A4 [Globodera pallida]